MAATPNAKKALKNDTLTLLKSLKKLVVQISIITNNKKFSEIAEPNIPQPRERLNCIKELTTEGIHCICRLQPLFLPQKNIVAQELIPHLAEVNCRHVIVEHLKLPVENRRHSFNTMLKRMNWDAYEFYKTNGNILVGREWLLPNSIKWANLQPIIESINKYDMTYGAGDYGLHHLGDTACCCGVDNIPSFNNWFQGNFANIIRTAKTGYIRFAETEKHWYPTVSIERILNSNCRSTTNGHDMLSYMKTKWNSPGTANAPDAFLGLHWSGDYDADGNCVYEKRAIK